MERLASDTIVHLNWDQTDYIVGGANVSDRGLILVAMPLPQKLSETVKAAGGQPAALS